MNTALTVLAWLAAVWLALGIVGAVAAFYRIWRDR